MDNGEREAFPRLQGATQGLTKREYFAGLAMQASVIRGYWGESNDSKAKEAVDVADALLKALGEQ